MESTISIILQISFPNFKIAGVPAGEERHEKLVATQATGDGRSEWQLFTVVARKRTSTGSYEKLHSNGAIKSAYALSHDEGKSDTNRKCFYANT